MQERKLQDFGTGVGFGTKTKIDNLEEIRDGVINDSVKKISPINF